MTTSKSPPLAFESLPCPESVCSLPVALESVNLLGGFFFFLSFRFLAAASRLCSRVCCLDRPPVGLHALDLLGCLCPLYLPFYLLAKKEKMFWFRQWSILTRNDPENSVLSHNQKLAEVDVNQCSFNQHIGKCFQYMFF